MNEARRSIPEGSSTFYSIRFAPRENRADLFSMEAMIRRLAEIPRECSDPFVARQKLGWWQEELENCRHGSPNHPLSRRLADIRTRRTIPMGQIDNLLRSIEREIVRRELRTLDDFDRDCADRGASAAALLTAAAGGNDEQLELSRALGIFSCQVQRIRNLGRDLRRGAVLLPTEPFDARGLDASRLLSDNRNEEVRSVLRELAYRFRAAYEAGVAAIPKGRHAPLGPAIGISSIASSLLAEIERDAFDVLNSRTSLTPVRKLWIAWRQHRRVRNLR